MDLKTNIISSSSHVRSDKVRIVSWTPIFNLHHSLTNWPL